MSEENKLTMNTAIDQSMYPSIHVMRHLVQFTKKNPMPVSNSQIETGSQCGMQWYLSYPMKYRKMLRLDPEATVSRDYGKTFHKYADMGFKDMKVIKGEVDLFGDIDTDEEPIPEQYIKGLYWIEDWAQERFKKDGIGSVTPFRTEWEIESKPEFVPFFRPWLEEYTRAGEQAFREHYEFRPENARPWTDPDSNVTYEGVWVKRMGFIDFAMRAKDGSLEIWDVKTGKRTDYAVSKGLRQQYYYKYMAESMGFKVSSIGLLFPNDNYIYQRVDRKVTKVEKDKSKENNLEISRFSTTSMTSVERSVPKLISKLSTLPFEVNYDPYYCSELCDYADPEHRLCNFESTQDLNLFTPVRNNDELRQLVQRLASEGITL